MSSLRTTKTVRQSEKFQDQFLAIADAHTPVDSIYIRSNRRHFDSERGSDFFVAAIPQNQLNDADLLWGQVKHFNKLCPESNGKWQLRIILTGHDDAPKKERRTKAAQTRPARAHTERTLADAPCGAWAQGTTSVYQNWRFRLKQRLDAPRVNSNCRHHRIR